MANKVTVEQMRRMCNDAKKLGFRPERLMLLDEKISDWSKSDMTPSIVARVLRHGQLAFEGAYGIMGPGREADSLTTDAIFPICSITKSVVSALLFILQEEGDIDLNHPVRRYVPEFTGDSKSEIHVWHLLTHTSGIIDDDVYKFFNKYVTDVLGLSLPDDEAPGEAWDDISLKIRRVMGLPYMEPGRNMRYDTRMAVFLTAPPTHKPHKIMHYCNTGYQIATDIITKITGKRIDEYASEKLFNPLRMYDSCFAFPRGKLSRYVTRGDEYVGCNWLNNDILDSESGAGGLKSTAYDMTRFGQMFLNHGTLDGARVLSSASVREITADHNAGIPPAEYDGQFYDSTWGLGWNVRGTKKDDTGMLRCSRSFEHPGFGCCRLLCEPEADIVATYFTVCKTDSYWMLSNFFNMVIGAIDEA